MMQLTIMDHGLRRKGGHAASLAGHLLSELKGLGHKIRLIGHVSCSFDQLDDCPIEKRLEHDSYDIGSPLDPAARLLCFEQVRHALHGLLSEQAFTSNDLIIFPTATSAILAAVSDYLSSADDPAYCACLAMMPPGIIVKEKSGEGNIDLIDPIRLLLTQKAAQAIGRNQERLLWFATNEEHARSYTAATGRPVSYLPLPLLAPGNGEKKEKKLALYLGDARPSKGFLYLPAIVEHLAPQLKKWTLTIQATVNPHDREAQNVLAQLRKQQEQFGNLTIETSYLDRQAFEAYLAEHKIVVLAYDPVTYRDQSSGLLLEAVAAQCMVVVPADTWLSRECSRLNAIGTEFDHFAPQAIAASIRKLTRPSLFAGSKAKAAAERYKASVSTQPIGKALVDWRTTGKPPGQFPSVGYPTAVDQPIDFGLCRLSGWHAHTDEILWAGQSRALFGFDLPKALAQGSLLVTLVIADTDHGAQSLVIRTNGIKVLERTLEPGWHEIALSLPSELSNTLYLEFSGFTPSPPKSGDARMLAVGILRCMLTDSA